MSTGTRSVAEAVARSAAVAEVRIGRGVLAETGALFRRNFGPGPAFLIADGNTWAAAGAAAEASLQAAGIATRRHILPARPRPKPTVELAEVLRELLAGDSATPIAVGAGVLNDLVKYAAFRLDRPYLCVPTAASMDGYASAGAPLSDHGFKKTIQCRPARAVLADLDVIVSAPPEMTAWGYGDLAGKVPAGGDWIVADALGVEPIDDLAWQMVQGGIADWLDAPEGIARAESGAIEGLFVGLILAGLAMDLYGSSRPASGADHQIAHLWEMEGLERNGELISHGACVAVACASTLDLFDWLLDQDLTQLDLDAILAAAPDMAAKERHIRSVFGSDEIADRATEEARAKHLAPAAHRARLAHIVESWPGLAARLRAQLIPAATMRAKLSAAGTAATAAEIGIDPAHLRRSLSLAGSLRSRYTLLDLLDETGLLRRAIDATVPAHGA